MQIKINCYIEIYEIRVKQNVHSILHIIFEPQIIEKTSR